MESLVWFCLGVLVGVVVDRVVLWSLAIQLGRMCNGGRG